MTGRNSIKQLFRRPVFLLLFILLLALSSAFLCVCAGLWANARETQRRAEETFTTIAVLNDGPYITSEEGLAQRAAIRAAAEASPHVRLVDDRQSLYGSADTVWGVWPEGDSDAFETSGKKLSAAGQNKEDNAYPYACGILVGTCTGVSRKPLSFRYGGLEEDSQVYEATFALDRENGFSLHPVYDGIDSLRLTTEIWRAPGQPLFEEGKRYIIYADNLFFCYKPLKDGTQPEHEGQYNMDDASDDCLNAGLGMAYNERARQDETRDDDPWGLRETYGDYYEQISPYAVDCIYPVAFYYYDPETLEMFRPFYINYDYNNTDEYSAYPLMRLLRGEAANWYPVMELAEGASAAEALTGEYGFVWEKLLRMQQLSAHSFVLFKTDCLSSVLPFNQQKIKFIEGRAFTEEEYATGAPVCVVSAAFALQNGLNVGDTIADISLYHSGFQLGGYYMGGSNDKKNVEGIYPYRYTALSGLNEKALSLTVVGIYSDPAWDAKNWFSFTNNTVFIPAGTVSEEYPAAISWDENECYEPIQGDRIAEYSGMYSLVLRNGSVAAFEAEMEEAGYGGVFHYFDQGYSNVAGALAGLAKNARIFLIVSALVWVASLGLFLALYARQARRELGIMALLGAGRKRMFVHAFAAAALVVLLATVLGLGAGLASYDAAAEAVLSAAEETAETEETEEVAVLGSGGADLSAGFAPAVSRTVLPAAAIVQLGVMLFVIACASAALAKKPPLVLAQGTGKGK